MAVKEGRLFSSPPPYGLRMENISFCRDYNPVLGCQHEELRTVVNLSQKDCGEHFARLSAVDDFVALKWKVRYQMGFPVARWCFGLLFTFYVFNFSNPIRNHHPN